MLFKRLESSFGISGSAVNWLFEIVKAHLPDVHAYPDDTQLYLSFKPDSEAKQIEAVDVVEE